MPKEDRKEHKDYHRHEMEDMDEFEKFMAMSWGTPKGIAILFGSLAVFLLSIGVFLWLLHLANIIK
jgi:hypothetical protein